MNKAVFIDKDGTLIENDPYNVDPSRIRFYPEVSYALGLMARHGFMLVIVSNQSGVAKGHFYESALVNVESTLRRTFEGQGVRLSGFYYCPHDPEGCVDIYSVDCDCRKPKPGLIIKASRELDIKLNDSWMIGDILNDVEAGNRSGCGTILVDRQYETEWFINEWREPDYIAGNLLQAAEYVIGHRRTSGMEKVFV